MGKYEDLIESVYDKLDRKHDYPDEEKYHEFFINNADFRLEEHNLWTYWQGRGVRNPKIMVVGQDWGSIEQSNKYYKYIANHPDEEVVSYIQVKKENTKMKGNEFTTDKELRYLFEEYLGYKDICVHHYDDLYFTNLIPGFRNCSSSTGNNTEAKRGISSGVIQDFKELLGILHPDVIICLGKLVGENIEKAYYDGKSRIAKASNFNAFLDEELRAGNPRPIELDLGNGKSADMFVIAHLGNHGKRNRRSNFKDKNIKKKYPEEDWKVIAEYIKNLKQ